MNNRCVGFAEQARTCACELKSDEFLKWCQGG